LAITYEPEDNASNVYFAENLIDICTPPRCTLYKVNIWKEEGPPNSQMWSLVARTLARVTWLDHLSRTPLLTRR